MTSIRTPRDHRRLALMAAVAGVAFLIVGYERAFDWRGIVSIAAGVLWMLVGIQHLRKARSQETS